MSIRSSVNFINEDDNEKYSLTNIVVWAKTNIWL